MFEFINTRTDVDLLGSGRYFIINGDMWQYGPSAAEIWLYGAPLTDVTSFTIADQTTGSALFTNSNTVDASMAVQAASGGAITGYMITETDEQPAAGAAGWLAEAPAEYTFAAGEGPVTLYAWVKDDADPAGVGGKAASITYSTEVPALSGLAITAVNVNTANVTFSTDVDAWGAVKYRALGTPDWTFVEAAAPGTAHSLQMTGLDPEAMYAVIAMANEVESSKVYYPATWPIEGDANLDCKVNILDLIFVRNRLNQSTETGDNWQADVNQDTKINILDLIYVRNRLNTKCE